MGHESLSTHPVGRDGRDSLWRTPGGVEVRRGKEARVARVQALIRTRFVQGLLVAASALALVGWLLPLNEASLAQEAAGKQPGVYALWQQARDCFRRGDYE